VTGKSYIGITLKRQ